MKILKALSIGSAVCGVAFVLGVGFALQAASDPTNPAITQYQRTMDEEAQSQDDYALAHPL